MTSGFRSVKGKFLISNSSITSDEFNKTVVFMIEHDSAGAFGLVVNRKSTIMVQDIISGIPDSFFDRLVPAYYGGPVDHSFVSIIHDDPSAKDAGIEVIPGVYLSRSFESLLHLMESESSRFHLFLGYSGWAANQLESEFDRLSWATEEAMPDLIFHQDPEKVWKEALVHKGGIYKYYAEHIKDPMLN